MDIDQLTAEEVLLASRAVSIHRVALRRKLDRLTTGSSEVMHTIAEMQLAQQLINKLQAADLERFGAA
jgi:hypothetical protein